MTLSLRRHTTPERHGAVVPFSTQPQAMHDLGVHSGAVSVPVEISVEDAEALQREDEPPSWLEFEAARHERFRKPVPT